MSFRVNAHLCKTCIFGPHTPLSPERFDQLRREWAAENSVQTCHVTKIGCRGHYEAAKRGEIPHPIRAITATLIDLPPEMDIAEVMQICEDVGWVKFAQEQGSGQ